jgi:CRISPR-associated protein Cas1
MEVIFTKRAIALAVENGIDLVFFDKMGKPFARTYSCKFENAASVRRFQVKAYDNGKGIVLITGIIKAKIRNMAVLLEILAKDRNNPQIKDMAQKIKATCEKLEMNENIDISRQKLLGIEG